MTLKFYGNYLSQPCRAVLWMLKFKNAEFEFVPVNAGSPDLKSPEFLAMNPNGLVPVLQDENFTVFEGYAIATYLADKLQWNDLYPTDLKARAKVNQYLHWHHNNSRYSTLRIMRPLFAQKFGKVTAEDLVWLENKDEIMTKFVTMIEIFLVKDFIAHSDEPTIADFACYNEFDQLELTGLFDFSKYPKVHAWMSRMKTLPHYDEVHAPIVATFKQIGILAEQ